ncbi:hypothetical protein LXL04_026489 [Taraxacum kok-saghyz]
MFMDTILIPPLLETFMSDLHLQIPTAFDPFAKANAEDSGAGSKEYPHIRVQLRNGRKDSELGQVIQLQGGQRKNVFAFLT